MIEITPQLDTQKLTDLLKKFDMMEQADEFKADFIKALRSRVGTQIQALKAETPVSNIDHEHMRDLWKSYTYESGITIYNAAPWAGYVVETGAKPHNIPNSFGWGVHFGVGGRFDGKFHPGMKPNPSLKTRWEGMGEYFYESLSRGRVTGNSTNSYLLAFDDSPTTVGMLAGF